MESISLGSIRQPGMLAPVHPGMLAALGFSQEVHAFSAELLSLLGCEKAISQSDLPGKGGGGLGNLRPFFDDVLKAFLHRFLP